MRPHSTAAAILLLSGCYRQYGGAPPPPPVPGADAADPPGRVARLSYVDGPVSFRAAAADSWVAAPLNRPLTSGDYLWTDQPARAELSIGSTVLRLGSRTGIGILNLDDRTIQIKLSEGVVQVGVRSLEADETVEIDTPASSVILQRTGDYRVEVSAAPAAEAPTVVTVRAGLAELAGASAQAQPTLLLVHAGEQASYAAAGGAAAAPPHSAPPLDGFDDFCADRERRTQQAASLQHVPREMAGWEDLDEYGVWQPNPVYDAVWYPRSIPPGWAPYRFGHWVWIEPWGWTWVDDAPWGFAPFHYGRWLFLETRWCWVPGPRRVRLVYSPALVVFVGGGRPGVRLHVSLGVGIGIGWFPLGPHEVYLPPYRASRTYLTNINVSHTIIRDPGNIHRTDLSRQTYMNRGVTGAVTVAPEDAFTGGRDLGRVARPASPSEAASYRIDGTAPPVAPTPRSLTADQEGRGRAPTPPGSVASREVISRRPVPPSRPSFEQRRPELERNPGRPASSSSGAPRQPQAGRSAPEPSPRQIEQRRQTIDREHQRQQPPPAASGRSSAPASGRESSGGSKRKR